MVLEVEDDRFVLKDLNNNRLLPSSLLWDYQDFRQTKHFQIEKLNYVCDLENLLCILSLLLLLLLLQNIKNFTKEYLGKTAVPLSLQQIKVTPSFPPLSSPAQ